MPFRKFECLLLLFQLLLGFLDHINDGAMERFVVNHGLSQLIGKQTFFPVLLTVGPALWTYF